MESGLNLLHLESQWSGMSGVGGGGGACGSGGTMQPIPQLHLQPYPQPIVPPIPQPVIQPTSNLFVDRNLLLPRRNKRRACSCLNCKMGLNAHAFNEDGTPRKKRHICHYPDCTRVYGNTSHLRAHLRGHTGERPFACRWNCCGKRFTRSDELQ